MNLRHYHCCVVSLILLLLSFVSEAVHGARLREDRQQESPQRKRQSFTSSPNPLIKKNDIHQLMESPERNIDLRKLGAVTFSHDGCVNLPDDPASDGWTLLIRNDDNYFGPYELGFSFNLLGDLHHQVYLNNNGYLSLGVNYNSYNPSSFPTTVGPVVAPFWADIDTRNPTYGGEVWVKQESNTFIVTWIEVMYYSEGPLYNTFQVIITDGLHDGVGLGNNACFCYGDMQWTTGNASGGSGGFGGIPATVGINKGDGIDFALVGRFDEPSFDFKGSDPADPPSGVYWLIDKVFCFQIDTGSINVPTLEIDGWPEFPVHVYEEFSFTVFCSDEESDTVTLTLVDGHNDLSIACEDSEEITISYDAPGTYTLTAVAHDDDGGESRAVERTVTVFNSAPVIQLIAQIPSPGYLVNTETTFLAYCMDESSTVQLSVDYGDQNEEFLEIQCDSSGATPTPVPHTYDSAGAFSLTAQAIDEHGGVSTPTGILVHIHDPFIAYRAEGKGNFDPSQSGKAKFDFRARYKNCATVLVPTGYLDFKLEGDNGFEFESETFDWLIIEIDGDTKMAMLKGDGTLNGEGSYKFFMAVQDYGKPSKSAVSPTLDTFRIKIVDNSDSTLVYDNGFAMNLGEDSFDGTGISKGDVKIKEQSHKTNNSQCSEASLKSTGTGDSLSMSMPLKTTNTRGSAKSSNGHMSMPTQIKTPKSKGAMSMMMSMGETSSKTKGGLFKRHRHYRHRK